MSSQVTISERKRGRGRWAVFGFVLIAALLVISWFVAPSAISEIRVLSHGQFQTVGLTPLQLQLAFTFIIFFVLGLVAALIVTLFAPKKAINVKETDLSKERMDNVKYHKMQRKRQRKLNQEMRKYVEEQNQK